ncbi:ABC transporter permease [Celeribacter naphthalenivorans]|uniref:ABC transporter permease n=1 Tax=Celeribacter naphthalenivorans TaxID=1614694 RepID=UPI001CFB1BD7|nr:ABC transporter permease [Celeribacter naphthalenivorans]
MGKVKSQHSILRRSGSSIGALMIREMSSNYGKAPGGYIWAILEPVAGIALMTILFSFVFRSPPLGAHFALFYASGILPFSCYRDISSKIGKSISFSTKLLSYPAVTLTDAILARLFLNVLTQCLVAILVLGGIFLFSDVQTVVNFRWIFLAFLSVFAISLGIGVMNTWLFNRFPVWEQIWNIFNRPMFLLSSVFYLFESAPEPFRSFLWFNPLVHSVGLMRRGLYSTYEGSFVSLTYVFGVSLVLTAFGLAMLKGHQIDT